MAERRPPTKIDFGELASSEKFTSAVLKLNANLEGTRTQLEALAKCDVDKLSVKEQVMLDLYLAYSVNSLYWMFLRTKGINPATHPIKSEINRVRESVGRANKICNRKQPTNRLNKEAAKRFIRSGLWQPGEKPEGGVVKKFDSANVAAEASSSVGKVNENGAEAKQFKAPNGNVEHGAKKFDHKSFGGVKASSSLSKVNENGGETMQFQPPNDTESLVKKFDPKRFGDEKGTSSYSRVNKKGGEIKQFKSPNRQPEGVFKKFDAMNIASEKASTSLSKVVKKGGETKKFNSTNVEAADSSTSFSQVNKKGGKTKQSKSSNWNKT